VLIGKTRDRLVDGLEHAGPSVSFVGR